MNPVMVDVDRIRVSARSVLANLELLQCEGLTGETRDQVRGLAAVLSDDPTATGSDLSGFVEQAGGLRDRLDALSGPVAATLVVWLDDALGRV